MRNDPSSPWHAKRIAPRMIVGSTICALALMASSWLLKGHPAGDGVHTLLYLATGAFLASQIVQAPPRAFVQSRSDGNAPAAR